MSIELADTRARWQNNRQALLRADFNHADEELARVLYFADHHPIIGGIINTLRTNQKYSDLDVFNWLKRGDRGSQTSLGFSLDEIEQCAQCLKVLEWAIADPKKRANSLYFIGRTTYVGSSSNFIDSISSAIENLFNPLYFYIDTELRNLETLITPVDIIKDVQFFVDNDASLRYQETHKLLTDAYKLMFTLKSDSSGKSWYQIGFACRSVLVRFGNEVFDNLYVPESEPQPKEDDAKNKLKWTARHFLKISGAGEQYQKGIESIIQANWDYVNTVGHRQESVTEDDARLALIYTYLTIYMLDQLVSDQ